MTSLHLDVPCMRDPFGNSATLIDQHDLIFAPLQDKSGSRDVWKNPTDIDDVEELGQLPKSARGGDLSLEPGIEGHELRLVVGSLHRQTRTGAEVRHRLGPKSHPLGLGSTVWPAVSLKGLGHRRVEHQLAHPFGEGGSKK